LYVLLFNIYYNVLKVKLKLTAIPLPAELTTYSLDVSDILLQITTLASSVYQKSYPRFNCDIIPHPYPLRLLKRRCRTLPEARPWVGTSGGTV